MTVKEHFINNGYDQDELNKEFTTLLDEHSEDKELVREEDKEQASQVFDLNDDFERNLAATIYNAWNELCTRHDGLREIADWYFGGSDAGFENKWDVFVGMDI